MKSVFIKLIIEYNFFNKVDNRISIINTYRYIYTYIYKRNFRYSSNI